jgi:4-hydroxy-2-oxoheptanedioate aldolase
VITGAGKDSVARCRANLPVRGISFDLGSPAVVEAALGSGLDWCVLDWEHALWNETNLPQALQLLAPSPMFAVVRTPAVSGPWIKKALDWGADGVLVPNVRTLAEVHECVREARYAPLGRRGVGPYRPSGFWGDLDSYVRTGNERTLLWFMIETVEFVGLLDQVCALPGVDGFLVGRNDLAQSLGQAYAECAARTEALAEQAVARCVAAGKPVGVFCRSPADHRHWAAAGATLLTLGDDAQFIRDGMAQVARELGAG